MYGVEQYNFPVLSNVSDGIVSKWSLIGTFESFNVLVNLSTLKPKEN